MIPENFAKSFVTAVYHVLTQKKLSRTTILRGAASLTYSRIFFFGLE